MTKLTIVLALVVSGAALAQEGARSPNEPGYTAPRPPRYQDSGATRSTEPLQSFRGEVEAIDKTSGTITLKHNAIVILGVPARTMDYPVKDSSVLKDVKVGDRVKFGAVMQGRSLLVTSIAPAN
jgi:Cu/Ag efflux protein CusF